MATNRGTNQENNFRKQLDQSDIADPLAINLKIDLPSTKKLKDKLRAVRDQLKEKTLTGEPSEIFQRVATEHLSAILSASSQLAEETKKKYIVELLLKLQIVKARVVTLPPKEELEKLNLDQLAAKLETVLGQQYTHFFKERQKDDAVFDHGPDESNSQATVVIDAGATVAEAGTATAAESAGDAGATVAETGTAATETSAEKPKTPQELATLHFIKGEEFYRAFNLKEAEAAYRESIKSYPSRVAFFKLGNLLLGQTRYAEAEQMYNEAIKFQATAEAYCNLGHALHGQKKYKEAEAAYLDFIKYAPNNSKALKYLGKTLNDQEKYAESLVAYKEALRLDPSNTKIADEIKNIQAKIDLAKKDDKPVAEAGTTATETTAVDAGATVAETGTAATETSAETPKTPQQLAALHFIKGEKFYTDNNLKDAEAAYRESIKSHPNRVAFLKLGNLLLVQNRDAEAEQMYSEAIKLWPTAEAYCNLGHALHGQKKYSQAEKAYIDSLKLEKKAYTYYSLGDSLLAQEKYAEALSAYEEALQLDPTNTNIEYAIKITKAKINPDKKDDKTETETETPKTPQQLAKEHFDKGAEFTRQKKYKEAEAEYLDSIKEFPTVEAYDNLGGALFAQKDYVGAEAACRESIRLHPTANAHSNLGQALYFQKKYKEAEAAYKDSLYLEKTAYSYFRLGDSLLAQEKYAEALAAYEEALKLDPTNTNIAAAIVKTKAKIDPGNKDDKTDDTKDTDDIDIDDLIKTTEEDKYAEKLEQGDKKGYAHHRKLRIEKNKAAARTALEAKYSKNNKLTDIQIGEAMNLAFDSIMVDGMSTLNNERRTYRLGKQSKIRKGFDTLRDSMSLPSPVKTILTGGALAATLLLGGGIPALAARGAITGVALRRSVKSGFFKLMTRENIKDVEKKQKQNPDGTIKWVTEDPTNDRDIYTKLSRVQQMNLRNTREDSFAQQYTDKVDYFNSKLKDRIKNKFNTPETKKKLSNAINPQEQIAVILDVISAEQEKMFIELEKVRNRLMLVRIAEFTAAIGAGMLASLAISSIGGLLSPDPPVPPVVPDPPVPPVVPDPPVPPVVPDPPVPPVVPDPPVPLEILDIKGSFVGDFSTATRLYDPSTSLVDASSAADLTRPAPNVDFSQLQGQSVNVDTVSTDLMIRNGTNIESITGELADGQRLTLTGNNEIYNVTQRGSSRTVPMRMFEVNLPSGQTGWVSGPYLKRV